MAISFSESCSFEAFSASSRQLSWDMVTSYADEQATLDSDLGLCNIEHLEIAVGVIVSLIAKRGSQACLKKSALLSSRALFPIHVKQITSNKAGAVRGYCVRQGADSCNVPGAEVIG